MKNFKEIALIGLAAIAILAAGCSQNNPTGPNASGLAPNTSILPAPNAMIDQTPPINLISLTGSMQRTLIEGGCIYFKADNKQNYEVEFANASMTYVLGQRITIKGYLQKDDANTICMIGPGFFVIDILKATGTYTQPPVDPRKPTILSGILGFTKDGCYDIIVKDIGYAVLLPINTTTKPWPIGSFVELTGDWDPLAVVRCNFAQTFMATNLRVLGAPMQVENF